MRIIVEGLIGVGKSTFTKEASEILLLKPQYESVEDNPFLGKFYSDPERWANTVQMHFLYDRFEKHLPQGTILDRSIWGDLCFANILHEDGILSDEEHMSYLNHSKLVRTYVPTVDLCIHLHVEVDEALKRIAKRGREFESGVTETYLSKLQGQLELLPSWLPERTRYIKVDWGDMNLDEIRESIKSLNL